jgi:hypothetical protein
MPEKYTSKNFATQNGPKRILRTVRTAAIAALLALGLSGCLLNRVVTMKEQFCDFESNFEVKFDAGPEFLIHHPVLLDSDVLWLSDASPTIIAKTDDDLLMTFVAEKITPVPDPDRDFAFKLHFIQSEGHYKLNRIQMDPKLMAVMGPEIINQAYIDRAAQDFCDVSWGFGGRELEYEISDQAMALLPSRTEILDLLGEPSEYLDPESAFTYHFRLKNSDSKPLIARMTVWFDESGQRPVKMESSYSRFATKADFTHQKMYFSVSL